MSTPNIALDKELTVNETNTDADGNTCLIIRCRDRNGAFLPCFALPLKVEQFESVYTFPLEFTLRQAGHLNQSKVYPPPRSGEATTPQS
jgi:hypothetical protein